MAPAPHPPTGLEPPAVTAGAARAQRTNLFLAATLDDGECPTGVRVRNLSASGARLEVEHCPSAGRAVVLRRGELAAPGSIRWSGGGACGVEFDQPITVALWMAGNGAQSRARIRREPTVASDLALGAALIDQLADRLSADALLVERLGDELQALDLLAQLLGGIRRRVDGQQSGLDGVRDAAGVMLGRSD